MNPDELVARQKNGSGDGRYELLDRLQEYVNELHGTLNYKLSTYTAVRSFFLHNRCELPRERFNIQNAKASVVPCMTVPDLRRIVLAGDLRDQSMILCGFMGFMGIREIEYINRHCYGQVKKQLDQPIIRVDIPKRKKNNQPYYTFIAGDALEALKRYLASRTDKVECIWPSKLNKPMTRISHYNSFQTLCRRIGLIPKKQGRGTGTRYGYPVHEMRDLARSVWHQSGADKDVAEFLMGHIVDRNKYDKIYTLDPEWVKNEYRKALPYLNIISAGAAAKEQQEELQDLREQVAEIRALMAQYKPGPEPTLRT